MMALVWWRLGDVLIRQRSRAAGLAGGVVAAAVLAALAWPGAAPLESLGRLGVWRGWSTVTQLGAALAALWMGAASSAPADPDDPSAPIGWEDWHHWGGLSPGAVTGGLLVAGWTAGVSVLLLSLPAGLFAARVSGAGPAEIAGTLAGALAAAASGAAWGSALLAALAETVRPAAGAALLAIIWASGHAVPGPGPAGRPWTPASSATGMAFVQLGLALVGAAAAHAAVRRRLRMAGVDGEGDV
ncbi:MAG TPA: hypothetical protein VIL40_03270 [Thermaerobacter sp.]